MIESKQAIAWGRNIVNDMPRSENGHGNYYDKSRKGCSYVQSSMRPQIWEKYIPSRSQRTLREEKQG